jgi:hypothetical protein
MPIATRTAHTRRRVNEREPSTLVARLIAHVNRKNWWHVPPRDSDAYRKRGKFLASSFQEAEFWGRPLDEPQKVKIQKPLIGDEDTIEKKLFGRRISANDITMEQRWRLDAKMKRAAETRGYDSIVLMSRKVFAKFRLTGQLPRSIELNIFDVENR